MLTARHRASGRVHGAEVLILTKITEVNVTLGHFLRDSDVINIKSAQALM